MSCNACMPHLLQACNKGCCSPGPGSVPRRIARQLRLEAVLIAAEQQRAFAGRVPQQAVSDVGVRWVVDCRGERGMCVGSWAVTARCYLACSILCSRHPQHRAPRAAALCAMPPCTQPSQPASQPAGQPASQPASGSTNMTSAARCSTALCCLQAILTYHCGR